MGQIYALIYCRVKFKDVEANKCLFDIHVKSFVVSLIDCRKHSIFK